MNETLKYLHYLNDKELLEESELLHKKMQYIHDILAERAMRQSGFEEADPYIDHKYCTTCDV